MKISAIVAVSKNGVIGQKGELPWKLSADLKHFKKTTMKHPILMGRKTYESIGRPLPGRLNVVISRNPDYSVEGCVVFPSVEDAISQLNNEHEQVFIIGGSEIYKCALPLVDEIHLTLVDADIEGDATFPDLNEDEWIKTKGVAHPADEYNQYNYEFCLFQRANQSARSQS